MEKKTILVIEDTDLSLKLVKTLLRMGHYRILEARDAENGIQLARSHQPDLILMDIQLPGMDGLEATRLMRTDQATADIPVVGLTSHAMRGDREAAMEAGFTGYITKPIDTRRFLDILSAYLHSDGKRVDVSVSQAHMIGIQKKGNQTEPFSDPVSGETDAFVEGAICDQQTGLYRFGYFMYFLDLEFKRSQRQNHPFSIIVIDTAELLKANRSEPVITDKDMITGFAQVVQENVRDIDLPARTGKEKISILLPLADRSGASIVAERIRDAMKTFSSVSARESGRGLTICSYPSDASSFEEMIALADGSAAPQHQTITREAK